MDEFFKSKAKESDSKMKLEARKLTLQEQEEQWADEREAKKAKQQAEIDATKANTQMLQALIAMMHAKKN